MEMEERKGRRKHRNPPSSENPAFRRNLSQPSNKYTSEQEIQLLRKRASCLAHKWMHYQMARLRGRFAMMLGFPLVVVAAMATAAQYYAQIDSGTCEASSGDGIIVNCRITVGGIIAMLLATIVTVLTGINTWLKPSETAELHRQASISYQTLVGTIEDEIAADEADKELGRVFLKELGSRIELLEQNAPSIHWFIMKKYTTDYADEQAIDESMADRQIEQDPRFGTSRSVRLEQSTDTPELDLMENFRIRLKTRIETERAATMRWELDRDKDNDVAE